MPQSVGSAGWSRGLEEVWEGAAGTSGLVITAGSSSSHCGQLQFVHSDLWMKYLHVDSVAYILSALSPPALLGGEWKKKDWRGFPLEVVTGEDCKGFNMKAEKT